MPITQKTYWHTTVGMPGDSKATSLPEKVDVAIIGGGYTGLSAAHTLARRGVNVAVLEAETIGWGASSRNGGMVLTGLKIPMRKVIKRYGSETAKRLFQCSLDSINAVEHIVNEETIDCGFARTGHLLTAAKPRHFDVFKDEAELMFREFGHKVRLVPRSELNDEIGSSVYHGALLDEVSAGLNPAQYVMGLARAAEAAGATLHARTRARRVKRVEGRFVVETERGQLSAESVLVGTSGYTGDAVKTLQKKIVPIGSFIIATERLSDQLANELSPKNRMIFDSMHYLNYFRLWDNRLVFGGRAAFFPENANTIAQSAEILRREMVEVYPQLKNAQVEYVWGGTLDFAFDMMPHVGEMNGIYYSLGYAGHGVAMATHLGKTVAEAMLKGNIKEHPLASIAFPGAPLGLYTGYPWFLPLAGAWHKILDWIE